MERARTHRARWMVALAAALLLAGAAGAEEPKRYTPLDSQELLGARAAAEARAGLRSGARSRSGAQGASTTEVLLVERRDESKEKYEDGDWTRRADVYIYDYSNDTLRHSIVDVESGRVDSEEILQGVQLPLTEGEVQRALGIAFGDQATVQAIEGRYREISGEILESPEQLEVKAFVFLSDSKPEGLNPEAQACGVHRCAQLLLYTKDRVVIEVQAIVDLSTGRVAQLLDF